MNILKSYWLRAGLTVLTFVFGVFMIVGAMEKNTYKAQTSYWFQMNAAGDEPTTTQLSNPNSICPDKFEEADCARQYNASQTERSEEHTSELQSRENLVCRLLLEKIKDSRARAGARSLGT